VTVDNEDGGQSSTVYQCSDGIDNDGDGAIDYPNDSSCNFATDTESPGYFFHSPNSWYEKIPENPEVIPNSQNYINDLRYNSGSLVANYRDWAVPIFYAKENTPLTTVEITHTYQPVEDNIIAKGWNVVPIPPEAIPAGNEASLRGQFRDAHMTIISHDKKWEWDFYGAIKYPDGTWKATVVRKWDLSGDGIDVPHHVNDSGVRACNSPGSHGLITYEEVEKGRIDHAIAFAYGYPTGSGIPAVYPCSGMGYGYGTREWAMVEGMRIQLDPSVNCDSLQLQGNQEPGARRTAAIVCKALQEYGMILVDGSAPGDNSLFFESFSNGGTGNGKWYGKIPNMTRFFPMDKLRVVAPVYLHLLDQPNTLTE
jgi:hypothetical protein